MTTRAIEYPKVPRWISTEAGEWAWCASLDWRKHAWAALSVQERARLLQEAEMLRSGLKSIALGAEGSEQ